MMAALTRQGGAHRDILGECPVWHAAQKSLYWVDIRAPAVRRLDVAADRVESRTMPGLIGAIALTDGPDLLVALGNRIALLDFESGRLTTLAEIADMPDGHRFNDGRCDPQGRFWIGTMHNVTRAAEGKLYRLDPSGPAPVLDGVCIPNSLAWSPDGETLYFADSLQHRIDAYPFDAVRGTVGARRVFAETVRPSFPDGSAVDAEGHLWNAEFFGSRVVRYAPDGRVDRVIPMPVDRPTCCAFGGEELRTLFVTTTCQNLTEAERAAQPLAGALLAVEVDVPGLPEPRVRLALCPRPARDLP
ncbi:MAG: SMP-30/gluconolactonase/LRE family protein [Methylobacteriaceae bacterium]|nr:SMP-30/gluconolactonase/LRE family protein [Methylobacteriaceae bacterium]